MKSSITLIVTQKDDYNVCEILRTKVGTGYLTIKKNINR